MRLICLILFFTRIIGCNESDLKIRLNDKNILEVEAAKLELSEGKVLQESSQDFSPYSLPNTEVQQFQSKKNGIYYILYISLPRNYKSAEKLYPVVYTLDADYSFAIAHNTIEHFVDRNDLPEILVVSIAYKGASQKMETYRLNRARDYTPTNAVFKGYGPEAEKVTGGGEKFRDFIIEELIPFIEKNYRVKNNDRTIVGHSFGGLFCTYMLLTRPDVFQRYIIVSASLWYDDKLCFKLENAYASKNNSLNVRVFYCAGEWENQGNGWPIMADQMYELVNKMHNRNYKGLEISGLMFKGETHNSIFPGALSRGLCFVFEK